MSYRPSARQPPRWLRSAIEAATQRSSSGGSVAEEADPRAEAPLVPSAAAGASGAPSPGHAPLAARSSSFRSWRSATSAASSTLGDGTAAAGSQRLAGPSPRRAPNSAAAVQLLDDGRSTTTIAFSRRADPAGAALLRSSSALEAPPAADDPTAVPAVRVVRVEKHTPGRPAAAEWRDAGDREALLRNAATDPDGVITLASGGARSPLRLAVWSRNAAAEETGGLQAGGPEPEPRAGVSDRWGAGLLSEPASLAPSEALLDLAAAPVDGRSSSPDSLAADGAAAPVLRRVTPLDGLGRPAKASYTYAQRWKQQPAHHSGGTGAAVGSGRAPPVPKPALPPAGTGRRPGSAPAVGRRPGATARSSAAASQAPSLSEPPQQQQQRVASPPAGAGRGAPLDSTFGQAAADPSCLTQLLQRGPFVGSRPHALSVTAGGRAARSVMASRRAAEADDAHPVAAMALYDPSSRTRQFVEATPGANGSDAPSDGAAASAAPDGRILSGHASPLRRAHAAAAAQAPAPLSRDDVITVLTPLGGREGGGGTPTATAAAPDVYIVRQHKHWGPTLQPPPPPAATELLYVAGPGQATGTPVSTLSGGASPLESSLAALSLKGRRTLPASGRGTAGGVKRSAGAVTASSGGGALSSLLEGPLLGGLPVLATSSAAASAGAGDAGGGTGTQVLSTVPGSVRAASHLPTPLHRVLAGAAAASALTFTNERRVGSVILRDVQRV